MTVIINVLLSPLLLPMLGARVLLLANSLSQMLQGVLLLLLIRRIVSGIGWRRIVGSVWKISISSLATFAALFRIAALGMHPEPNLVSRAWYRFGQFAISSFAFLAIARIIGVEELTLAWNTILAKFEPNVLSPPENRDALIA